jgi:cyclophilin family peptidyl-prolyl cis-trans isomerase
MSRLTRTLAKLLPPAPAARPTARPRLEALEDRNLLAASSISGVAFVDANGNGAHDANEAAVSGAPLTLTGATAAGTPVSSTVTTDANGNYLFANVLPGNYQLQAGQVSFLQGGGQTITLPPLADGQTITQDIAYGGVKAPSVTLRMFLASTTAADFPSQAAGSGVSFVNSRPNSPPFVSSAIANVAVAANATPTTLDLSGNFSDPDLGNSTITLNTIDGPVNVELFDKQTPRTVANFLNYVTSGRYDNSIFHRLVPGFVLQGGGFTFNNNGLSTTLTPIPTDPAVQNEPGISNTQGTLAMAKLGGDPNSATDQFFFNLANNSSNLDNQNGGFTVFGKVLGPADLAVLNQLAATPTQNQSSANAAFSQIPLLNYNGTNFPSDANANNFLLVGNVVVDSRPEMLTYSVVGNTNPALVTPAVNNERLTLNYTPGLTGSAVITVQATDTFGASVQTSFTVTVGP